MFQYKILDFVKIWENYSVICFNNKIFGKRMRHYTIKLYGLIAFLNFNKIPNPRWDQHTSKYMGEICTLYNLHNCLHLFATLNWSLIHLRSK